MSKALEALKIGARRKTFFDAIAERELRAELEALKKRVADLERGACRNAPPDDAVEKIKFRVARFYNVPLAAIDDTTKWSDAVWARHAAMYLCWSLLKIPMERICRRFKKGCHGTVGHAIRHVNDIIESSEIEKKRFEEITALLRKELGL